MQTKINRPIDPAVCDSKSPKSHIEDTPKSRNSRETSPTRTSPDLHRADRRKSSCVNEQRETAAGEFNWRCPLGVVWIRRKLESNSTNSWNLWAKKPGRRRQNAIFELRDDTGSEGGLSSMDPVQRGQERKGRNNPKAAAFIPLAV